MLRRRGSANQAAVAWVYPTTRAHVEEHKVHTLFVVSVLVGSRCIRWTCRLVLHSLFSLVPLCFSVRKALGSICVLLWCSLVREALCCMRGGGVSFGLLHSPAFGYFSFYASSM